MGIPRLIQTILMIVAFFAPSITRVAADDDFIVYSIYRALDLGDPGEKPQKDYFVNMGSRQGIRPGTTLQVLRRVATYDLTSQKLYKDVQFPIAKLKVIHVEPNAAIARLDQMLPPEKTPAISPRAVMVGDLVRNSPN
jgi:hypothetical protein